MCSVFLDLIVQQRIAFVNVMFHFKSDNFLLPNKPYIIVKSSLRIKFHYFFILLILMKLKKYRRKVCNYL